jgi:hypothetical protein
MGYLKPAGTFGNAGQPLATPCFPWLAWHVNDFDVDASGASVLDLTHADTNLYFSNIIGAAAKPVGYNHTSGIIDIRTVFGSAANGCMIQFYGGTAANQVFGFDLYGFRNGNGGTYGEPIFLCPNTAALGTMLCDTAPVSLDSDGVEVLGYLWADTIAGTACGPFDAVISDSGSDRIATLSFDLRGLRYLYLRTFTDSDLTEAVVVNSRITCY